MGIRINNLKTGYGREIVIDDVTLHVPSGSVCSVIGPNGCGKSTLLKSISRNLPVQGGSIEIDGRLMNSIDTRELARKMAFLSQSPHIPEQFSVRELVSYGRFPHTNWMGSLQPGDQTIITQAMEMTGVEKYADRDLSCLSGGEQQRVWIAMALAQEAEILLLDEPTTHLDIAHQFQTLELIGKLNREMNRTMLMVIHDLNQAARYSDFLFVMKEGRLFAQGRPDEIITEDLLGKVFSIQTRVMRDEEHNCPYFIPGESKND